MINGGTISWCCRKQNIVALSSADAEYVAISETYKELIWLKRVAKEFGVSQETPLTIYTDSQSAIGMTTNEKFNNRSKHIDTRHHHIRDAIKKKKGTQASVSIYFGKHSRYDDKATGRSQNSKIKKTGRHDGIDII